MVLVGYRYADFEHGKKPKGGPLEIENFFVEGAGPYLEGGIGEFPPYGWKKYFFAYKISQY